MCNLATSALVHDITSVSVHCYNGAMLKKHLWLYCTTSISEAGARSGRKGKPGLSFRGRGGVSGVTRNKTGIVPKQTPAVKTR